jgi:hypothetical protein
MYRRNAVCAAAQSSHDGDLRPVKSGNRGSFCPRHALLLTTASGDIVALLPSCRDFAFLGTNAYWLSTVVTDDDIKKTLTDIKARGVKVVRTWGFNGKRRALLSPY